MTLKSISVFLLQKKNLKRNPSLHNLPAPESKTVAAPNPRGPPPQVLRLRDLSDEAIPSPLPYSLAGGPPEVLIS